MKKICFIAALVLMLSAVLTSCGGEKTSTSAQGDAGSDAMKSAGSDKVLVAYYSNTGNTEAVAQQIAELTGADLTKIERKEAYGDLEKEAEEEIQAGSRPEIVTDIGSVEGYDTIFVGYPIWWDEAPAMISTFLADNDFSGKTVIPFCTSSSDDIGNSLHIFSELCQGADVEEGLTANDENEIEPWLRGLGVVD